MAYKGKPDYYEILGVSKNATSDEIKKAFRKKARTAHPDAGGSEEEFKRINEAYEVLSDERKRKAYDAYGTASSPFGNAGGGYGANGGASPFGNGGWSVHTGYGDVSGDAGDWSDILEMLRNIGMATSGRGDESDGWSSVYSAPFDAWSSAAGRSQRGSASAASRSSAPKTADEYAVSVSLSDLLNGRKVRIEMPGFAADGGAKKIDVKVPPDRGISPSVRVKRESGRGDAVIRFETVVPDGVEIDGDDIRMDARIPFPVAVAGGKRTFAVPSGRTISLTIPPMTKAGSVFSVKGEGIGENGRCLLRAVIDIPADLTEEEKKAIADMVR